MSKKLLVTLGPSSLSEEIIRQIEEFGIYVFRINLSHTPIELVATTIDKIQEWTNVPICLDSEGAQLRNQNMVSESVNFTEGQNVEVHFESVIGNPHNISFTPANIARQFSIGDEITVDFHNVCLRIIEIGSRSATAIVVGSGVVGSNKASDVNRDILFDPLSPKDKTAIEIGREKGIKHFALSFTSQRADVEAMRKICGSEAIIISKIESPAGVANLEDILEVADEILVDRGDLSRKVPLEKIPFLQRKIIAIAKAKKRQVYVATNLLETMGVQSAPSRAELNDVVSTLLMGADGLVLAAETAIGKYPVGAVNMIRTLIEECEKWTEKTSLSDIMSY